jgi:hypothetical protein
MAVLANGATTARSLAAMAGDVINVLNCGADPMGVVNSTAAFTQAWASGIATGRNFSIWIPAGTYLVNSGAIYSPLPESICAAICGEGMQATTLHTSGTGTIFDFSLTNSGSSVIGAIQLADFSMYPTDGGTSSNAIVVTGSTANDEGFNCQRVHFGSQGASGNYATQLTVVNFGQPTISDNYFEQSGSGIGLNVNGSSNFNADNLTINNNFFLNGNIGLKIGDGNNSYVSGVVASKNFFVGCATSILWNSANVTQDSLVLFGNQFNPTPTGTGVQTNNVYHIQCFGNYFLGGAEQTQFTLIGDSQIYGNLFYGGSNRNGVNVVSSTGLGSVMIYGNNFFDFSGSGQPFMLGSTVTYSYAFNNSFASCVNFGTNSGSNNFIGPNFNGGGLVQFSGGIEAAYFTATNPPNAAIPITVGAAPFAYTSTGAGTVFMQGGASISVYVTRGSEELSLNTCNAVPVQLGDVVTVNFTTAPVMAFFPA